MNIGLASIVVNDPLEAFEFYTKILGFKERMYMPEYKLAIVVSPEAQNGTGLLLEPNENPISSTYQSALYNTGIPVITLGTDNIEMEFERLKALGVVFRQEPTKTDWGTEAVFDDTCGNFVQIFQV